jgi:hypothetical protein
MKEFYASAKYKMKIPDGLSGVAGGVIIPSGVSLHTVERRDLGRTYPHLARRLLDPQMYLATLNPATCRGTCANLASYGWFPITQPLPYDSSSQTQAEWKKEMERLIVSTWTGLAPTVTAEIEDAIRLCVEVQVRLGVEAVILPSPLTTDVGSLYNDELEWLETGLAIAGRIAPHLPHYASVAVSDTALRGTDPWSNPLLDLILDQVTARRLSGVYLVLEQANEDGYYCTHPNTVGAFLRLCFGLKRGGVSRVVVAFAGTAGLMGLVAGADTWTTGWYRGERRLRRADFEQEEGRANPAYYSQPLAGEFHLQSDLDRVVARGFLPRVEDVTDASEGLIRALVGGALTSSVPEWQYRQSNVNAAIEHFLRVCARETTTISALGPGAESWALRWLEGAAALAADLYAVGGFQPRTAVNHQHGWLQAFRGFLSNRY